MKHHAAISRSGSAEGACGWLSPTSFWLPPNQRVESHDAHTQPSLTHPGAALPLAATQYGAFNARPTLPEPHQSFLLLYSVDFTLRPRSVRRSPELTGFPRIECERFPGLLRPNLRRCRRLSGGCPALPLVNPRHTPNLNVDPKDNPQVPYSGSYTVYLCTTGLPAGCGCIPESAPNKATTSPE